MNDIPSFSTSPAPAALEREWPFVSVVMPVRNEGAFMDRNLESILSQEYPADRMEVLVADGMSDDNTRAVVARWAERDPRVRLIDNVGQIVSTGLNQAIREARGEIILRIDGHVHVSPDFVRQNIALLDEHPEAWCVGGPIKHVGANTFGRAVAAAQSSRIGVGTAYHRFENYEGYVEGAVFPAIRRWVFDRVGNFDENLVRNQDDEFNFRVNQAHGKIFISPRVHSSYFVRDCPSKLFRQYFQYSFWRVPILKKHRRPTHFRQLVPPLFYLAMLVCFIVGVALRQPWLAAGLPLMYCGGLLLGALFVAPRLGLASAACYPIALLAIHGGYALGYWYGLWSALFHRNAWNPSGAMAKLSPRAIFSTVSPTHLTPSMTGSGVISCAGSTSDSVATCSCGSLGHSSIWAI